MLNVTRKQGEEIFIRTPDGEIIKVVMLEVKSASQAKIGIDAPDEYLIVRGEIAGELYSCCFCGEAVFLGGEEPTGTRDDHTGWPSCFVCAGE